MKVNVTIVGNHDTKAYNGQEQSITRFTVTNIEYTINGQVVDGSGFSPDDVKLKEGVLSVAKGTDVDKYYMGLTANSFTTTNTSIQEVTFIVTDGYIEITPKAVVVKITGNHDVKAYDGQEHEVTGYTIDAEGIISINDINYNGEAKAARTDVGITNMNLKAGDFS